MQRLFGSSSRREQRGTTAATTNHPPPQTPAAQLRETLELLDKRWEYVARLVDKEVANARAHQAINRKREALECIKRKKLHEKELEQLSVKKLNLMHQEQTLHALKFNTIVVDTQVRGADAIEREIKKVGGVEGVEQAVDRADDALADASDVLGATSRAIGSTADTDEAELLEELEQLEMDQLADELSAVTTTESVPVFARVPRSAPMAKPASAEDHEDAEMSHLQASMQLEQPMPMPMMAICH